MWFWLFMLCSGILIPLTMIIGGRMMWKHCPKEINGFIGYRTKRSMKNKDTWKFAHEYCGKLWWRIGWIVLVPSLVVYIPIYGTTDNRIGIVGGIVMLIQVIVLICSMLPTEIALKRTFG